MKIPDDSLSLNSANVKNFENDSGKIEDVASTIFGIIDEKYPE